jgi:hypothetical protein
VDHDQDKLGDLINEFWTELDEFQSKTGPYTEREYIFKNTHIDIKNMKSYIWHKKETLRYTNIFGRFACRVCSKILGIGSAERSWGDVKHLKTNKRSHLSADRVKKQATIYGSSCIEMAKYEREKAMTEVKAQSPIKYWMDDDFNLDKDDDDDNVKPAAKKKRPFYAYIEDWENEAIRTRHDVNEQKLLEKYGGLFWKDPDNNNLLLKSNKKELQWSRKTKTGGGYCVIAHTPDYNEYSDEVDPNAEPWYINDYLIEVITKYYKKHPKKGVLIVEKPGYSKNLKKKQKEVGKNKTKDKQDIDADDESESNDSKNSSSDSSSSSSTASGIVE